MIQQIENSAAYKKLAGFQQDIVKKRDNRLKIEDAIIIAREIGYEKWSESSPMAGSWKAIVKELA